MSSKVKMEAFIENLLKTDFPLNENILSKEEYQAALHGKRFFTDTVFRTTSGQSKRLMAILFSDVVNYSALMGHDEQQALEILAKNRNIHERNLSACNGRLLKEIGDGILAIFDSVSDAVECGMRIQQDVQNANTYKLRIGIHLGEVNTENNDVIGDGVNIASRVQSIAEPGTVYISGAVFDNIKNQQGAVADFIGEKILKNISEPVRIYRLMNNAHT
jgi:adenylate cyclase